MVTVGEIRDRDGAHGWLVDRPDVDAGVVAHRMALRVLPLFGRAMREDWARERKLTALPALWLNLARSAADVCSTSEAEAILSAAFAGVYSRYNPIEGKDFSNIRAAEAACHAAGELVQSTKEFSAGHCSAAIDTAAVAARLAEGSDEQPMWDQVREDARLLERGDDLSAKPLWSIPEPDWFRRADQEMRAIWRADNPAHWTFWSRWWEGVKSGKQVDCDLQRDVALIPDEVWAQGAGAVAERIARIILDRAVAATPNSEEILRDEAGRFYAVPVTTIRPELFRDAKEKVIDTVVEIRPRCSGNQYSALVPDLDRLDDHHARYADNPQRIHDVYEKTIRHIDQKVASGELPADELVLDLRQDLDSGAIDIRRSDTEVAKTVKARVAVRLRRLQANQRSELERVVTGAASEARTDLAKELKDDLVAATDESVEESDKEEGKYRLFSRLSRMAKRRKDDAVKLADDAYKLDRGAEVAGEVADKIPGWWETVSGLLPSLFG